MASLLEQLDAVELHRSLDECRGREAVYDGARVALESLPCRCDDLDVEGVFGGTQRVVTACDRCRALASLGPQP